MPDTEAVPNIEALQDLAEDDRKPLQGAATLMKDAACAALGISQRTLQTYMASGKIPSQQVGGKTRFLQADVDRLKADLATPVVRGPILPGLAVSQKSDNGHAGSNDTGALARIDPEAVKNVANAFEVALRNALQPLAPSPGLERWMDLKAAVEYSGLSRKWLLTQARAGVPWAMNIGTAKNAVWRFRLAGGAK
jgi:excisionase family DNA binding protein